MGSPTRGGPWIETQHGEWTLRLLAGDEPLGGLIDVEVVAAAQTLVGTLGSLLSIADVMATYRHSGECLSGKYFWAKSLIVVDEMDEGSLFSVLRDLIDSGEAPAALEEVVEFAT
ncbi:MAG: hypothetical protein WKF86_10590 [Acidimicrobiales bacterium]